MARLDGDTAEIQQFAFNSLLAAAGSLFRLAGGAAMLFVLEWRLALLAVAAAPLNLIFLAWARPRTQARAEAVREARGGLSSWLVETVAGLPSLRALDVRALDMLLISHADNDHSGGAEAVVKMLAYRNWNREPTIWPAL